MSSLSFRWCFKLSWRSVVGWCHYEKPKEARFDVGLRLKKKVVFVLVFHVNPREHIARRRRLRLHDSDAACAGRNGPSNCCRNLSFHFHLLPQTRAKAGAHAARLNFCSRCVVNQRGAERCVSSESTVLRAAYTGMCADALRRIAKARTEKPVEVRNIGKASLQCDIGNSGIAFALAGKEHERMFQP